MTTTFSRPKGMCLASLVTAINVLVESGFAIAALVEPQALLPAGSIPTRASFIFALYAGARVLPLALIALVAIYKRATAALLILGTLAGAIQLLDAGIGAFQHDLSKSIGPLVIGVIQLIVVLRLNRSMQSRSGTRSNA